MAFGMESRGVPKAEQEAAIARVAALLQIEPLLNRKPGQLSGGQRQRVAMGRALVRDPELFLFDEPLSNLDAKLRVDMRTEIKKLHQRVGKTTVYVTHDQVEAMTLASRIAVMHQGEVQQFDEPDTVYNRPANMFVAGFMGSPSMNFIPAEIDQRSGAVRGVRSRTAAAAGDAAAGERRRAAAAGQQGASSASGPSIFSRWQPAMAAARPAWPRLPPRSKWSSRPAPRPWRCCASASTKSSAASIPTTRRAGESDAARRRHDPRLPVRSGDRKADLRSREFPASPHIRASPAASCSSPAAPAASAPTSSAPLPARAPGSASSTSRTTPAAGAGRRTAPTRTAGLPALRRHRHRGAESRDRRRRGRRSGRSACWSTTPPTTARQPIDDVTRRLLGPVAGDQPAAALLRRPGGARRQCRRWAAARSSTSRRSPGAAAPPTWPAYATAKAAVIGLTRALARAFGGRTISASTPSSPAR